MTSFSTHDVDIETLEDRWYTPVSGEELWQKRFQRSSWSSGKGTQVTQMAKVWKCSEGLFIPSGDNALVKAVGLAYNKHIPLSLGPDAIWSAICHGFSMWINENAEAVRDKFVKHQGKVKLEQEVPPNPDWDRVLGEFSDMIADHIGNKRELFVNDFSTTGTDARLGSEALLMYGMAQYFDYGMSTCCGFPRITLEGTPDDWHKIVERVNSISGFALGDDDHLKTWTDRLKTVVREFADASDGKPNIDFWRSLYREGGGSGGPFINGYIMDFFPYLTDYRDNTMENTWNHEDGYGGGVTMSRIPANFSPVDVEWNFHGQKRDMIFQGGVIGVCYEENTVRPEVGWCVSQKLDTGE